MRRWLKMMKSNDVLPEGWNIVTLNNICEINPRLDKSKIPADLEVSFVPMAAVGAMRPMKVTMQGRTSVRLQIKN